MTERIFYEDQYIKEFKAKVIKIEEKDNKYYVQLNRTAFFPGGGGQSCDLGSIEGHEVIDVFEDKKEIIHVLKENIKEKEVNCKIDWDRRIDGMQQHLGQHVLSGCFFNLFNINTCGIHLGTDISTVDLVGEVTEDQIRAAERKANEVILNGHNVDFINSNRKEAKAMGLRRELATKDEFIRVVKIEDLDINACCGVHPSNTKELQLIKIKSYEKHKGNTRIYFLAGNRAVQNYLYRDLILESVCNYLSAGDNEVMKTISNLNDNIRELKDENISIKSKLSTYEIKELISEGKRVKDILLINKIYTNSNMKYLTKVANKLVEDDNVIDLFANKEENKASMLFAASKNLKNVNMGNLLKDSITLIDGKGGGSNVLAQGGGKNVANIQNALDYSIRRIKELL